MHKHILEFKHVRVIYDMTSEKNALDIDELVITQGEHVAIIGPNGAGKSTLINLITRELYPEPDDDTVCKIYGKTRWHIFDLRAHLGIVNPGLQQKVKVGETVLDTVISGFFSSIGIPKKTDITRLMLRRTHEALDFLGIAHLANRLMTEISTGESRLALIARALAHKPKALLLDEPTSGLDIRAAHLFRTYLQKLAEHGISVIVVTHDFEDIIPAINRVVIMDQGKIRMDGDCRHVLTNVNMSKLYGMNIKITRHQDRYSATVIKK